MFEILLIFLAETDRDLDLSFYFYLRSTSICLGVLFSFSSLFLKRFGDPSPSVIKGWLKASSQLILSSSLFFKHLLMKSLDLSEMVGSK